MKRPIRKAMVALLINKEGKVCLAQKKQPIHHEKGQIVGSQFTYNGPGGKTELYDFGCITLTGMRELWGEARVFIFPWHFKPAFRAYFYLQRGDELEPFMDVTFFFVHSWLGTPQESKEMGRPCWFDPYQEEGNGGIPWSDMMPADKELFQKAFTGKRFVAEVKLFGKKGPPPEVKVLDEKL